MWKQKEGKVKEKVAQSCLTLCHPRDSTVHGIHQARILEWVAYLFSSGSSWPRNWTRVSCIAGRFFTSWARREGRKQNGGSPEMSVSWDPESVGGLPSSGLSGGCIVTNSWLCVTPWTVARQAPLSMGFPGRNTGVGCHFLLQGIFPDQAWSLCLLHWVLCHWAAWEAGWAAVTECRGCSGWGGLGLTNIRNLFLTALEAATEVPVRPWWGPYFGLQMAVFPFSRFIVMGGRRSFLGIFFFFFNKFPLMRALLSWSNYLSNALPPNNITLGFRILIWICGNTWRRKWQPTPVLSPGKSHWWRSLVGCSPWGHKELGMTERLHFLSFVGLPWSQ